MTTTTHIVKLATPEDVIGSIPAVVGFHPSESLVVMCMRGERKRQDLTMRYDLPSPEHEPSIAVDVAARAIARDACGVMIVCFTEAPDEGTRLPRQALVDETTRELGRHGIGYLHLLLVRAQHWWSYDRDHMNPLDGTPLPDELTGPAAEVEALTALGGRVVRPDREHLERSVRGPVALREVALDQRYREAVKIFAGELEAHGHEGVRSRTLELTDTLLGRFESGRAELDDAEACRALVGFSDVLARDAVIGWGVDDEDRRPLLGLLTALAQRALDADAAPICAMLAGVGYLDGDGALGNVAIERALRSDPGYSLARLLDTALQSPVDPHKFRAIYGDAMKDFPRPSRRVQRDPDQDGDGA